MAEKVEKIVLSEILKELKNLNKKTAREIAAFEDSVFSKKIVLSDTETHQVENYSVELSSCWIYAKVHGCYIGNKVEQYYQLAAVINHDSSLALYLENINLSDLYVQASADDAEIYIIGTYNIRKQH